MRIAVVCSLCQERILVRSDPIDLQTTIPKPIVWNLAPSLPQKKSLAFPWHWEIAPSITVVSCTAARRTVHPLHGSLTSLSSEIRPFLPRRHLPTRGWNKGTMLSQNAAMHGSVMAAFWFFCGANFVKVSFQTALEFA